jgi:tetratricopeptide (TPR) repeat protein
MRLCAARWTLLWALAATSSAQATEAQEEQAKRLYAAGQAEYDQHHYQVAYERFKEAFLLEPRAEFRYNMASALQGLGRSHEAAEELRVYLRLKPDVQNRSELEQRIRELEEADRLQRVIAPADAAVAKQQEAAAARARRRRKIIAGSVSGAVLAVGLGLGIGLGLGLHDWHTPSSLGTKQATP